MRPGDVGMFVQSLAAYADRILGDRLGDVALEEKNVSYFIEIDEDGRLLDIIAHFVLSAIVFDQN